MAAGPSPVLSASAQPTPPGAVGSSASRLEPGAPGGCSLENGRGSRACVSPSTRGQAAAGGWELRGSSVGRTSLASTYQEDRLSWGRGPASSDGSAGAFGLGAVASARSQSWGGLAASALTTSRAGPEAGLLVPLGPPGGPLEATVDGARVGGGQGAPSHPGGTLFGNSLSGGGGRPPAQLPPEWSFPPGAFPGGLQASAPTGQLSWARGPRLSCPPRGWAGGCHSSRDTGDRCQASGLQPHLTAVPFSGLPWEAREGFPEEGVGPEGSHRQGRREGSGGGRRVSPGAASRGGPAAAARLPPSPSPRPRAVLRSWKPFLMSASSASMTHTSSCCFLPPFLTERPGPSGTARRARAHRLAQPRARRRPHQASRPRPAASAPPPPPAAASSSRPWPPAPAGPCSPAGQTRSR